MTPGDSYENAGFIVPLDGGHMILYNDGSQHLYDPGKVVKARTRALDGTLGAEEVVMSSANDETTWGCGVDSTGRVLAWVLTRDSADLDTGTAGQTLRRRSALGVWSTVTTLTGTPKIRLINPIISVAGVGLVAHWQGVNPSEIGTSAHGVLISDDDGATWDQVTIASGLLTAAWPIEVKLIDLGAGKILGIGRTETIGNPLFQLTCDGDPSVPGNWTVANTTITDQSRTPSGLAQREDGTLDLYYYDRTTGRLRHRSGDPLEVFTDPTAWSASTTRVAYGALNEDGGYPNAVRSEGKNLVVYYSGTPTNCRVFLHSHDG